MEELTFFPLSNKLSKTGKYLVTHVPVEIMDSVKRILNKYNSRIVGRIKIYSRKSKNFTEFNIEIPVKKLSAIKEAIKLLH